MSKFYNMKEQEDVNEEGVEKDVDDAEGSDEQDGLAKPQNKREESKQKPESSSAQVFDEEERKSLLNTIE